MVLIIQEPRAHQPEGQEIVPFEDLVDFGDGEKNVAFLIKKTYEKNPTIPNLRKVHSEVGTLNHDAVIQLGAKGVSIGAAFEF